MFVEITAKTDLVPYGHGKQPLQVAKGAQLIHITTPPSKPGEASMYVVLLDGDEYMVSAAHARLSNLR